MILKEQIFFKDKPSEYLKKGMEEYLEEYFEKFQDEFLEKSKKKILRICLKTEVFLAELKKEILL